jgi:hypothetical protein
MEALNWAFGISMMGVCALIIAGPFIVAGLAIYHVGKEAGRAERFK